MDGVRVHRFRYLPSSFETLAYTGGMLPGLRRRPWRLLALPLFLAAEWLMTLRLLRRHRFDIIHAHWLLPHGLIAIMARAFCGYHPALVCTAHGADLYGLRGAVARTLKRYTVRHSDHVTVVSHAMLETLCIEAGSSTPCSVQPMGVDTRKRFVPPAQSVTRSGLLFVGRLADKKGVDVLLDAMTRLDSIAGLSLQVVGSGTEETQLKQQALRLGLQDRVHFVGPVRNEELPAWYQRSLVLVFPSVVTASGDREGLGLVPVEALACGCAVAASDLPAIRDVVRDGETGLLSAAGDAAALAVIIEKLWRDADLRTRLVERGLAHVRENFDWERVVGGYAALFDGLASER
jgi:glycosyltransferase involved in cell wall biosynthesis